jgi:hypothetical protein
MDGSRFDAIARSLAESGSRRRLLAGLTTGAIGLVGVRAADAAVCRAPGERCRADANCCTGACAKDGKGRHRCDCQGAADGTACAHGTCCAGACCAGSTVCGTVIRFGEATEVASIVEAGERVSIAGSGPPPSFETACCHPAGTVGCAGPDWASFCCWGGSGVGCDARFDRRGVCFN